MDTSFHPSAKRAAELDRHMRDRLAQSLTYIADEASGPLGFESSLLKPFLMRLRSGPVSPLIFGAYCELVLALESGELQDAHNLLQEISAAQNHDGGPAIVDLADPGKDRGSGRYLRLTDTDQTFRFDINPPPEATSRQCRAEIGNAFVLMERGDPELAAEIRTLLREIVLAVGPDDPKANDFDGASSFMLWGAVVLNARNYSKTLDVVQALAHESGHNLLFGLSADGPLIENDDVARYRSPLRTDARPMDGIVHAVYVTARMHRAVAQLVASGVLSADELEAAQAALTLHARNFAAGMETVDRDAQFTPVGRAVFDGARAYMAAFA
jgi:HEXXH motif-containing protein